MDGLHSRDGLLGSDVFRLVPRHAEPFFDEATAGCRDWPHSFHCISLHLIAIDDVSFVGICVQRRSIYSKFKTIFGCAKPVVEITPRVSVLCMPDYLWCAACRRWREEIHLEDAKSRGAPRCSMRNCQSQRFSGQ